MNEADNDDHEDDGKDGVGGDGLADKEGDQHCGEQQVEDEVIFYLAEKNSNGRVSGYFFEFVGPVLGKASCCFCV